MYLKSIKLFLTLIFYSPWSESIIHALSQIKLLYILGCLSELFILSVFLYLSPNIMASKLLLIFIGEALYPSWLWDSRVVTFILCFFVYIFVKLHYKIFQFSIEFVGQLRNTGICMILSSYSWRCHMPPMIYKVVIYVQYNFITFLNRNCTILIYNYSILTN